ncbi:MULTISPECIES: hypothetical protein [Spirulina sp. CCY15215]|uniref:hypothetical protein n=1 Tax=Spirulina sp. CCY15215 TaxID=2767591 RepID=UPI0019507883|nr:hypothetical protein [Spirulina major]
MTQAKINQIKNLRSPSLRSPRGRLFPDYKISESELAQRRAEKEKRCQKARSIFDNIRPQLIEDHYNWYVIVEPNSGDYFIDVDEENAVEKARQKYPESWLVTFKINETGACGRI